MPLSQDDFTQHIAELYQHLYDLVYLRNHALTDVLVPDPALRRKEKAWQIHHLLLDVVDELDPGPQAPAYSKAWRRHRLMVLRYVDGLDVQNVAQELAVSRRHYYREHDGALEAIAEILWNRYVVNAPAAPHPAAPGEESDHLALLRLEAARMAQTQRYVDVADVITGSVALFHERLRQQGLDVQTNVPQQLPDVPVDRGLLRQVVVSALGNLANRAANACLCITAQANTGAMQIELRVEPPAVVEAMSPEEGRERLAALQEMGKLCGLDVHPRRDAGRAAAPIVGFEMHLALEAQRTVLVVDDNRDILELFQRYLTTQRYHVLTAETASQGLALARSAQPHAITLDLMMPGQDGWELLQTLLNQPDTRHIPVIVCSVLKQQELALSLGAAAFLEKPVTKQDLLATLEALEENAPPDNGA